MIKKQLAELCSALSDLNIAREQIENIHEQLQSKYDDMSEHSQQNERGEELAEEIQILESIIENLTTAFDDLNAIDGVELS